ncbi:RagB/SusD family nutrient uptake outer membrane protein [Chryseobacterium arachidis]|uniref:RagB/SusD family nutrient uptake outer membrane protein n=1 Tax=Chryseobacterium arachidis TaxID=1416778 RepID=UPI003609FFAE
MKKIIFTAISFLSIYSCSDFLYSEPVEKVSITEQLGTKEGMLVALNGAYYQLRSTYFTESAFVYGDLLAGNLTFSPSASTNTISIDASVTNIYQFDDQKESSDMAAFYSSCYQLINNINLILQYADQLPDASSAEISEIKAEALALRAFTNFYLYKHYGQNYTYTSDASHLGIVYNTAPLKVGIDYPTRKTVAENFVSLENDIQQAISLFQPNHAIPVGQKKNFMNIDAAKLLAAEIALWKNDWQKAIDYSNDIIQNSSYTLTSSNEIGTNWAASESIFEIANTNENEFPVTVLYSFTDKGRPNYVASEDIYNLFSANDQRKNLFETQNLVTKISGVSYTLPYHFTKKYKIKSESLIYRLGLAYFIRAEASLKSGNSAQALNDVNIIRNRAGLTNLSSVNLDILLEEKKKRICF